MSGGLTTNFISRVARGTHDLTSDTLMAALYSAEADNEAAFYTTTDEVVGAGYDAGGQVITGAAGGTAHARTFTFEDISWTGSLTAQSVMIYNASKSNRTIAFLNFGVRTISGGTLNLLLSGVPITITG